jgi:hypothetical protein
MAEGPAAPLTFRMRRLTILATLLCAVPGLSAQSGWTIRSAPAVEFWYHAMAIVGLEGFGALPLYDPGYAGAVRSSREARGIGSTALERQALSLRAAFEADSTFELLHFMPLYASTATPEQLLTANAPGLAARVLRTREQRALFDRFLTAARNDLDAAWNGERRTRAATQNAMLAAAERRWANAIAPAIGGYLQRYGLTSGVIVPVPGLGTDGRFLAGSSQSPALVAVQLPRDSAHAEDAAFFAVRELCYPAVRRALARLDVTSTDRVAAEALSGRAAVRCGAQLLDQSDPALGAAYREAFLRAAGARGDFEAAFPVNERVLGALRDAISSPAQ